MLIAGWGKGPSRKDTGLRLQEEAHLGTRGCSAGEKPQKKSYIKSLAGRGVAGERAVLLITVLPVL